MKKILILGAIAVASVVTGCKSIEVDRRGHQVAMDGQGQVIKDKDGNPIVLDMGWNVDYFQHWNWQQFDSMHAKAGEAELDINGYQGGAGASNLVALVSTSLSGVATITEKVAAAIVTSGGSVAVDLGQQLIQQAAERFVAKGGDASTATVTCDGTDCKICDASGVCETCTDCIKPSNIAN